MNPWDYHADLTKDRLTIIGQMIADVRNTVFEQYDDRGDDSWAIGCRAFSWVRMAITRAAASGEYPWLGLVDPSMQFIFRVGPVPIRFLRGDPDEPLNRTLNTIGREGEQIRIIFPGEARVFHLYWRFLVETDFIGDLEAIWFIGTTPSGILECKWKIPVFDAELSELDEMVGTAPDDPISDDEGDELPAPSVTIPDAAADDAAET